MALILRRRKLGRTSVREISRLSETGIVGVRNDQPIPAGHDLLIRWGCTSEVPIRNVLNTVEAIHRVNDKRGFREELDDHDLCPTTGFIAGEWNRFPAIVRPAKHAQGRNIHLVNSREELLAACRRYREYYISDYIAKVAEYRVFVVQGRVACVAKKTPADPNAVAWNVAQGGSFDNVRWDDWPLRSVKAAIAAFKLSGLDFGGVDVMEDAEGKPYILEINSAPSLTSPYRQECMAKCFDWIIRNGKAAIGLVEARGGYRKFVHPSVCEGAVLP